LLPLLTREIPLFGCAAEFARRAINNNDLEERFSFSKGAKQAISLFFRVEQRNTKLALPPRLANGS
jgi:hypothetical protein